MSGINLKINASHYIAHDGTLQISITLEGGVQGEYGSHYVLDTCTIQIDGQEWMRKIAANRLKGE